MIQPIGVAHPGLIAAHVSLPHVTLASAIATWRRRACAIALGRCGHAAASNCVSLGDRTWSLRRLASYADYVELRALRSAARSADVRLGDADAAEKASPTRLWPFHYPVIEPVSGSNHADAGDQHDGPGAYLDVIF